ncbi:GTPase IMAP family member 9-like isoform X1 [Ostrea edulis]|uniref:GTPase IMAP family member 9-like isoform X1 n=1 Tax=Ostrea edulis TaxID=37623 RepID=UPI0020954A9A|nr:GTPase IMAP family member 9-like isoform X1 [Ostrea edulis]
MEIPDTGKSSNGDAFRVLVVGGIGHGKSAFINTVLGEYKCKTGVTWGVDKSITKEIQEIDCKRNDHTITFIDTPSLKTLASNPKFKDLYKSGFHAIVIVYSIKPFTQHYPTILQRVKSKFPEDLSKYAVIVLTFQDYLEDATVKDFLNENRELKDFVERSGVTCVAICNNSDDERQTVEQRDHFFNHLDVVLRKNVEPLRKKATCSYSCIIGVIVGTAAGIIACILAGYFLWDELF